jgi:hypothetical protein
MMEVSVLQGLYNFIEVGKIMAPELKIPKQNIAI